VNQSSGPDERGDLNQLKTFVLGELKRYRNPGDIVEGLCRSTGWDWKEAEQFLETIRIENRSKLEAYRNRLYIFISLLMIVSGTLSLAVVGLWAFYNPRRGMFIFPDSTDNLVLFLLNQLGWFSSKFPFTYLFFNIALTGIGMMVGGVIGLVGSVWRAFKTLR
jgi:hypothetical protein